MSALIRPATAQDIPSMIALLEQLYEVERDFDFDEDLQRQGLEELLATNATVLVADLAGQVQGMAQMQELVSTASGGKVGLIEDLVVDAEHRSQGLGEELLSRLVEVSEERGYARIQLLADRENHGALKFYGRLGWFATNLVPMRYEP